MALWCSAIVRIICKKNNIADSHFCFFSPLLRKLENGDAEFHRNMERNRNNVHELCVQLFFLFSLSTQSNPPAWLDVALPQTYESSMSPFVSLIFKTGISVILRQLYNCSFILNDKNC